jgi:hypothetical protein|tara:strand:- start:670 stop:909 length:240 start_codon:yes stop_codon:yes gene_type:complete
MLGEIKYGIGLWWLFPLICLAMMFFRMGGMGRWLGKSCCIPMMTDRQPAPEKRRSVLPTVPNSSTGKKTTFKQTESPQS